MELGGKPGPLSCCRLARPAAAAQCAHADCAAVSQGRGRGGSLVQRGRAAGAAPDSLPSTDAVSQPLPSPSCSPASLSLLSASAAASRRGASPPGGGLTVKPALGAPGAGPGAWPLVEGPAAESVEEGARLLHARRPLGLHPAHHVTLSDPNTHARCPNTHARCCAAGARAAASHTWRLVQALEHDDGRGCRLAGSLHQVLVLLAAHVGLVRLLAHELALGQWVVPYALRGPAAGGCQLGLPGVEPVLGDGREARDLALEVVLQFLRWHAPSERCARPRAGAMTWVHTSRCSARHPQPGAQHRALERRRAAPDGTPTCNAPWQTPHR